jgi:alpha-D-xyloside xylohydrolase
MRAMVMDFGYDPKTNNLSDQYMFGPNIMVCPVYQYKARLREVYFPENSAWYDYETKKYIAGGKTIPVNAPYERIPLFIKAGSIIPAGNLIQSTKEQQAENITLQVYTGKDASFTLYEDENVNYNYEKGNYAKIQIDWNEDEKTLTIGETNGKYAGMPSNRNFRIEWFSQDEREIPPAEVKYFGSGITIKKH